MTELEEARAHLRKCQEDLRHARDVSRLIDGVWYPGNMKADAARAVLAALSWVHDVQTRGEPSDFGFLQYRPPSESDLRAYIDKLQARIANEMRVPV